MDNSSLVKVVLLLCCYACKCKCNGLTSNYSTCPVNDLSISGPSCNEYYDGNTRAVPGGRNRVCKVVYNKEDECYRINRYTGGLQDLFRNDVVICSAIVGMNLTFVCTMEGSILYRHGVSERNDLVNIPYITSGDAGVYECRQGDEVVAFNISVTENVHIGEANDYGYSGSAFSHNNFISTNGQTGQCCRNSNDWHVVDSSQLSRSIYVYGEEPVLTFEGLQWDPGHYPTDLDINITKDMDNPLLWIFTVGNIPVKTGLAIPEVYIIIKACNNFSSFFMCIHTTFDIEFYPLITNEYVPQNKTAVVRENVTFECIVGSTLPQEERDYSIRVLLEFTLPSSSNSSQSFRATCSLDLCTPAKKDYPLVFNNHVLQSRDAIENVSFTAQVPYVSEDYNGSIFVCTIMYKNVIQWQREAHLTLVSPPLPEGGTTSNYKTTAHTESSTTEEEEETPLVHNSVKVTIAVCIVVVAIITVMVVVSIPIAFMLKKKRQLYRFPPDEVPLTNRSAMHSSQSTICSENPGSPIPQQSNLPYIEISSVSGIQPDIIVGEPRPCQPHNSMDSGVDEINSIDNISLEGGPRKPRTSLQLQLFPRFHPYIELSPVRLCRSESDLTPSSAAPSTLQGSSMLDLSHRKCVVYISYTDRMADWVKSYLKPHIESWKTTEVMLHELDMIPGLTISGERQRLILEADKIVIVVSSDYSQSQWCSYELVHAIQKEPALCRGKIIPILVDGCQLLPSVIQGLVPLPACDLDFNSRLWYAIHRTPQIHC